MAQRTKRKLPTSAYALPGALAINHINTIPDDDGECGGLIEIELARTAEMEKLVAPRFIFLTTKNRKIGDGKPERGAFLLLQTMSVEGNDEITCCAASGYATSRTSRSTSSTPTGSSPSPATRKFGGRSTTTT